VQANFTMRMA